MIAALPSQLALLLYVTRRFTQLSVAGKFVVPAGYHSD
jgi:hypothetical protein